MVNGSGNVTTDFMKVAGFPKLDFNTSSTAAWGNVRMRVAWRSTSRDRWTTTARCRRCRAPPRALIDQLSALAKNPGDIYISIVPFAKDVNIGASIVQPTWIDWTDWDANNGTSTCTAWNWKGNCTASYWTPDDHNKWTGCVTDRDQDYDTKNTAPTRRRAAGRRYLRQTQYYCKSGNQPYLQPIMPLSYDWADAEERRLTT